MEFSFSAVKHSREDEDPKEAEQSGSGKRRSSCSPSGSSIIKDQDGFGIDPEFVSKVATLVTSRLSKQRRLEEVNQIKAQKNIPSSEVLEANTFPPIHFNTEVFQNDLNTQFDQKVLLQTVPEKFKSQAKSLLEVFDDRSNEFTWDRMGNIYVDQVSIPNANMFKIFPKLFQKSQPKRLSGLQDVKNKIKSMGLNYLILSGTNSTGEGAKLERKSS